MDLRAEGSKEAVQRLMHDVAELAAWCACAGIEMLSVYEKTGKHCRDNTRTTLASTVSLGSDLQGLSIRGMYADMIAIYRRLEITYPRAPPYHTHDILVLLPTPATTFSAHPRTKSKHLFAVSVSIAFSIAYTQPV